MNILTALFQTKIHLSPAERALASTLEIMLIGAAITALGIGVAYIQHNGTNGIDFAALLNVMWISFVVAIVKGATALMPQVRTVVAQPVIDAISHLVSANQASDQLAPTITPIVHVDAAKLASEVVNHLPQSQIATLLPTLATLLKAELMKPVAPPARLVSQQYPGAELPTTPQVQAVRQSTPPQGGSVIAPAPSQVWDQLRQPAQTNPTGVNPTTSSGVWQQPAQPNADWMTQGPQGPNRAG